MPRWGKQLGAFLVGAAAVAGGVAALVPLLQSSPPPILAVNLGAPEWAAQDLTLGGYVAWQQREASTLGLKALGGEKTASANSEEAGATRTTVILPARYVASVSAVNTKSTQTESDSTARTSSGETPTEPGATTSAGGEKTQTTGSSTSTVPTPAHSTTTSSTNTTSSTSTSTTVPSTVKTTVPSKGPRLPGRVTKRAIKRGSSLREGVLNEVRGHLDHTGITRLQNKVKEQEAVLHNPELQPSEKVVSACEGLAFGGCAPESAVEAEKVSTGTPTTGMSLPGGAAETATEASSSSASGEAPTMKRSTQSQQELLEIANGARLGSASNASLIPPLMTAGLSHTQRVIVARALGDAVSFEVHTHGWIGRQLWLTWTMYEKHDGYWNPSSHVYLIDHAEAYLVPSASDDEGILTFWFPIPKSRGEYQVRYFIRAPGSGEKLASGRSPSFRS